MRGSMFRPCSHARKLQSWLPQQAQATCLALAIEQARSSTMNTLIIGIPVNIVSNYGRYPRTDEQTGSDSVLNYCIISRLFCRLVAPAARTTKALAASYA